MCIAVLYTLRIVYSRSSISAFLSIYVCLSLSSLFHEYPKMIRSIAPPITKRSAFGRLRFLLFRRCCRCCFGYVLRIVCCCRIEDGKITLPNVTFSINFHHLSFEMAHESGFTHHRKTLHPQTATHYASAFGSQFFWFDAQSKIPSVAATWKKTIMRRTINGCHANDDSDDGKRITIIIIMYVFVCVIIVIWISIERSHTTHTRTFTHTRVIWSTLRRRHKLTQKYTTLNGIYFTFELT